MARRMFTIPCLTLIISCGSGPGESARRPIIILDIDTLRADHLGLYGYSRSTSPHLDAFAEEAIVFDCAFSQAPNTAPSQTSILTTVLWLMFCMIHLVRMKYGT